jgi:hypothetical protein
MGDRRTVYMTDDGTNTGLWKFIADRKNDLSSGERCAARGAAAVQAQPSLQPSCAVVSMQR